jgi:hypothetical protein
MGLAPERFEVSKFLSNPIFNLSQLKLSKILTNFLRSYLVLLNQ